MDIRVEPVSGAVDLPATDWQSNTTDDVHVFARNNTNAASDPLDVAIHKTACPGERGASPAAGQVFCCFDATATHRASDFDGHGTL